MKSKLILTTTIALSLFASGARAEQPKFPPINPALTYWQAAAVMPDLKGGKADTLRDLVTGKKAYDAAAAKEILDGSSSALQTFARAARSSAECDWGMNKVEGPAMTMPHVSKMMELARLAILKADSLFEEGKPSEGVEWLLLTHRAARHAGAGDLLISALVQDSIEASIINAAGQRLIKWDDATRQKYLEGFAALPRTHSIADALSGEEFFVDWIEKTFQSGDPERLRILMAGVETSPSTSGAPDINTALKVYHDQFVGESGKKTFEAMRDIDRRAQEALRKPWKESEPELNALAKEADQGSFLLKLAFPTYVTLGPKEFEIETLHTMFKAALQYGPKLDEVTAATFKDSFDGEPLVLKKGGDGVLTLTTAKQYGKKPLVLKLGK